MKRLTEYTIPETGFSVVSEEKYKRIMMEEKPSVEKVYNRLKKIEDILGGEYDLGKLMELVQAKRKGRCIVLPCKVGDKLYEAIRHRNSGEMEVVERIVQSIEFFADSYYVKMYRWKPCKETNGVLSQRVDSWAKETDIGKTVFLIRKEAEAALRREQE